MPSSEYLAVKTFTVLSEHNLTVIGGKTYELVGPYKSSSGYVGILAGDKPVQLHRAVYIQAHGEIPEGYEVDHIDLDKENNYPANLRAITKAQNCQNRPTRSDNLAGYRGVSYDPPTGKYRVEITINKRTIRLGRFKSLEEAISARKAAELEYHPFAGNANRPTTAKVYNPPKYRLSKDFHGKLPRPLAET